MSQSAQCRRIHFVISQRIYFSVAQQLKKMTDVFVYQVRILLATKRIKSNIFFFFFFFLTEKKHEMNFLLLYYFVNFETCAINRLTCYKNV